MRRRCIVRIVGLGFQAGDEEDSILNDSLFMAQVGLPRLLSPTVSRRVALSLLRDVLDPGHQLATGLPAALRDQLLIGLRRCDQELCNGGSLRDLVMQQMNKYNKVSRPARHRSGLHVVDSYSSSCSPHQVVPWLLFRMMIRSLQRPTVENH